MPARRSGNGSSARSVTRTSSAALGQDKLIEVAHTYNHDSIDDFLAAIGYGAISAQSVVMRLGVVDDTQSTLPPGAPAVQPAPAAGARARPCSTSVRSRG